MAILVDYECRDCGWTEERWTPSPPPPAVICSGCGKQARRTWFPIGLSGGRDAGCSESQPARGTGSPGRDMPLCNQYPQIPGLCHMSQSAGRMWLAKYRRDNRAVERELARQEEGARTQAPSMSDAITHHHFPASPK